MKIYWNGDSKNIIGKRLKELCQQQNISQRILAAGLTLSGIEFNDLTILRIEKGERFVPDYEIAVIADYFKVSANYLLGRKEQPKIPYQLYICQPMLNPKSSIISF